MAFLGGLSKWRSNDKAYYPIGKGFAGDRERLAQDREQIRKDALKGTERLRAKYPKVLSGDV